MERNKIYNLYLELLKKYGDPVKYWPQWCAKRKSLKLKEEIALEAILVQRTSWRNAEIASKNLKKGNLLSINALAKIDDFKKLVSLVKPAGFYNTKPRRLLGFSQFIQKDYGSWQNFCQEDLETVREKLLSCYGIGPETADTILLYATEKPTFVIDEYTKRFVKARNLASEFSYDFLKNFFEENLPKNVRLFQDFHALIIIDQKGGKYSSMGMI